MAGWYLSSRGKGALKPRGSVGGSAAWRCSSVGQRSSLEGVLVLSSRGRGREAGGGGRKSDNHTPVLVPVPIAQEYDAVTTVWD